MRNSTLLIALLLLISVAANAQTDKYRLAYRDDPATTMVIGWSGADATVYYGTTDEGTSWSSYPMNQTVDRTTSHKGMTNRFVRLTGLTPKTVYYFVIKDASGVSDRFSFMTLSDNAADPISFISGGDTRQGVWPAEICDCRDHRKDGNEIVAKIRPDFIAFNGDFIRNTPVVSDADQEWKDWFDDWQLTIASDGRMFPLVLSLGNHEDADDIYNLFDIPISDTYYALNFGGNLFRLYTLNSEFNACSFSSQLTWFQNDLAAYNTPSNTPYWKFVQYHIPMVPQGHYSPVSDEITCWADLYDDYGVRLSMESHTHIVKTTWPLRYDPPGTHEGFVRDDSLGAVFIGEGSWGAPHRSLYSQFPTTRDMGVFDSFFWVQVNTDTTSIRTVKFENISSITATTDDAQGSDLPSGVTLWDNTNGAANGEVIYITNHISVAVDEAMDKPKMANIIYPNPTKDVVKIEFNEQLRNATIEVYDARGRKCKAIPNVSSKEYELDMSDVCQGVNYIHIKTEDDVETHKIVKIK